MGALPKAMMLCTALLTLVGCGSETLGEERPCTAVGSSPGVGLTIKPPYAARVASATMRVCWNGAFRTPRLELRPSTTSVSMGCQGDVCGASASPDGGEHDFAQVPGLPKAPVFRPVLGGDSRGRRRPHQPGDPACRRSAGREVHI